MALENQKFDLNEKLHTWLDLKTISMQYNEFLELQKRSIVDLSKENLKKLALDLQIPEKYRSDLWKVLTALRNLWLDEHKEKYNSKEQVIDSLQKFKDSVFDKEQDIPKWSIEALFAIQAWLNLLWFNNNSNIDWQWWNETKNAIIKFQKYYNKSSYEKIWESWLPWAKLVEAMISELTKIKSKNSKININKEIYLWGSYKDFKESQYLKESESKLIQDIKQFAKDNKLTNTHLEALFNSKDSMPKEHYYSLVLNHNNKPFDFTEYERLHGIWKRLWLIVRFDVNDDNNVLFSFRR